MEKLLKVQQLVRAAKALLIESENAQRFDAMQCTYILDPTIAILDTVLDEVQTVVEQEQSLQPPAVADLDEVWQAATKVQMYPFSSYPSSQPSTGT
ncbi:MAG: hypothetical protein AAGG51_06160 [Cyanobacteria bacterium P01_G01_bin.54]